MKNFWNGLIGNLAFLVKKGTVLTLVLSFGLTACFYHFVLRSPELNATLVTELCGLGFFLIFLPAFISGFLIFRDDWPALDFENFWDQIGWHGERKERQSLKKSEESDAIEETIRIMQASRDEILAREKKSDDK